MQPEWANIDVKMTKNESKHKIRKNKNYKNSQGRIVNTKEYAIAWGVINKPYSAVDLCKKCRDPEAPSYSFITKKGWKGYPFYYKDLIKAGMQPRPPRTDMEKRKLLGKAYNNGFKLGLLEKDYDIARIAAQYGVTTKESYIKIRKEKPQSKNFLPSMITIVKRYGSWKRFTYEIMKYNVDYVINEYVNQSAEQGRWLTLAQCDRIKLPIRGIMDILKPSVFNALCYKKLSLLGYVIEEGKVISKEQ